jgi:translation initiation factor 6
MLRTAYYGNPFLGLFFKASNSLALAPIDAQDKNVSALEQELGVKVVKTLIGGSNLVGVYTAMNSNGILLPNVAQPAEVEALRKAGMNVLVSGELNNAHGNNLCVNDKGGIINPHVDSAQKKRMEDALGIELVPLSIAKHTTVGSACVASNKGFLAHYAASDDEIKAVEDALKVPGDKGTVNTGAGYVSAGIVHNDKGFVAGEASTGYELGKIESALGYIG